MELGGPYRRRREKLSFGSFSQLSSASVFNPRFLSLSHVSSFLWRLEVGLTFQELDYVVLKIRTHSQQWNFSVLACACVRSNSKFPMTEDAFCVLVSLSSRVIK